MKAYTISNGFRQGREAAFGALLMELCIGGERIASFLGIRTWYESVGTFRIILCILIFVYFLYKKTEAFGYAGMVRTGEKR